LKIHAGVAKAY